MKKEERRAFLIREFEWLHAHPELSYEERETTNRLKNNLRRAGITVLDLPLATGLVARMGNGEPHIVLRADIDALSIEEMTNLPYKSVYPGKMHACGHDFHTVCVLGAALIMNERKTRLKGTVTFVFQPAEEAPGGAKKILATHALDGADLILGLHSSPLFDVGTIGIKSGAVTASVDKFGITFRGKGTHAAHPERGIDPIAMAANFACALQSVRGQNLDPATAGLIGVTHIESGNTWNVIPETAFLEGTARSLTVADRLLIKKRIHELAAGIAAAFGGSANVDWYSGPPATDNDETLAQIAKRVADRLDLSVADAPVSLAGEDFAYYQESIKGLFIIVGTGEGSANHSTTFMVDTGAIDITANYLAELCETMFLNRATSSI